MAAAAKQLKPTLEDYIFDMETRPPDNKTADADLWTQLQQKESDLVLAAELGKALLEKNEELAKSQEKIIEEYSVKLEVSHGLPFHFLLFFYCASHNNLNKRYYGFMIESSFFLFC